MNKRLSTSKFTSSFDSSHEVEASRLSASRKVIRTKSRAHKTPAVNDINIPTCTITSTDTLYVKQATYNKDAQWIFVQVRPIRAKVLDTEWLADYAQGKYPIVPGTKIRVELLTTIQLAENGMPIEGKATYEVIKIHDVIYPEEFKQLHL